MNTQEVIHQKALELFKKLQGYPDNTALGLVDPIFRAQSALNRRRWYDLAAEVIDTRLKALEEAAELIHDTHERSGIEELAAKLRPDTDSDAKAHPISPAAVESEPAPPPRPPSFPPLPNPPDAFSQ